MWWLWILTWVVGMLPACLMVAGALKGTDEMMAEYEGNPEGQAIVSNCRLAILVLTPLLIALSWITAILVLAIWVPLKMSRSSRG